MSDQTPPPAAAPQPNQPYTQETDRQMASFAHLSGILGILIPLILWLVGKDRGPLTNSEGKESVNFQITALIGYIAAIIVGSILTFVTAGILFFIGGLLQFAIWVTVVIFCIQGFTKAKDGHSYTYPFAIRLIK